MLDAPSLHSSDWYSALTLPERIELLRSTTRSTLSNANNSERAKQRLNRWRSQFPFIDGVSFSDRLALDGIAEEEFMFLLGEPICALRDRCSAMPSWLATLANALSPASLNEPMPSTQAFNCQDVLGFLNVLAPLLVHARDRVIEGVEALTRVHRELPLNADTVVGLLFANLPGRLLWMLGRTMVLELNVARLQKLLDGETPEERFHSFAKRLCDPGAALGILQEYPVLARQLVTTTDNWVNSSIEFLGRLGADWDRIQTTFKLEGDAGMVVCVDGALGDSHRAGRMVLITTFDSGFKLVYKPRGLAVDSHFQRLLQWLNTRGDHAKFRTLTILDRGSYGWVEFVEAEGCRSVEEVQRFYERQGGYLALLYALEATDFHYENLIVGGENPVLLDLETFFHPRMGELQPTQYNDVANTAIYHSVLSVGLLPQRIYLQGTSESMDISGIGRTADQMTPHRVPRWELAGTDEMRFSRKRVQLTGGKNRPILNGAQIDILDYAGAIASGFTSIYRLLLQHRDELLAADGPLAWFAADEVRVVLRPTWTYGLLLNESFHPDVLHDAFDRDRLFDRLWVDTKNASYLKLISSELEDLQNADIPIFTTRPNSRDLWTSSGRQITNFFGEPGMDLVQRRIQQLSDDDLDRQLWFIRASLASLSRDSNHTQRRIHRVTEPQIVPDRERLLAHASALGDRLEVLALRDEESATWVGLKLRGKDDWCPAALGVDLYDGLAGVALFLAYLGAITEEARYTVVAQAAFKSMLHKVKQGRSTLTSIGAFDGWGGYIYALTHVGVLWNQPQLLAEAEEIVSLLPDLIEQDEELDIIGGAAGCIGSLITLYRCAGSDRTLAAALQCGDRLISRARLMNHGIGWITSAAGKRPLAGFSHGAAGISWALLELAAISDESRFQTAALDAIAYERSLFSVQSGNWPDLRELEKLGQGQTLEQNQYSFMTAWCHGASGIGLARLRALQHLDDPEIHKEIETSIKTTLLQGFGGNHSLCHGDLGNLELLLQASTIPHYSSCKTHIRHLSAAILESIDRNGWLCAVPLKLETPGLMLGLAGIGYELLRLAEPKLVPSVLVLQPPHV